MNCTIDFICTQNPVTENYSTDLKQFERNLKYYFFDDINNKEKVFNLFESIKLSDICIFDTFIAEEYFR